jgi:hypothetical protein
MQQVGIAGHKISIWSLPKFWRIQQKEKRREIECTYPL